jgi:aminomethyltransferase
MMLYDQEQKRAGIATSFMYSPVLQRHVGISRLRGDLAHVGATVKVELTINHRYNLVDAEVTRIPFFNPPRKTA